MPTEDEWDAADDQECAKLRRLRGALSFRSKEVGDYHLGKTLGKGSCAVVKLGTHCETGKKTAIKILNPKTLREQKEVLREVEALQRLNHPNITRLEKVIRENGYTCLILELGAGGELFEYIMNNGKLAEDEARYMFRQLISGVQYCHANLIAHRDLKPENLLLDERGNIKISDFGLSNVLKPGRLFSTWCGSPVYTPPEVVLRQQYDGVAMDIWSLGVILYVIVTGGMPWRLESNVVRNIDDLIKGHYEIPDFLGVSEECRELIGTMLIADSSQRATVEMVMNHKWTCKGYDAPPQSHIEPKQLVSHPNEIVLEQLATLGYDIKKTCVAIKTDPTSPALTAYHLLLSKHQRALNLNGLSASDAESVTNPGQFMENVTRGRSKTHPGPLPGSPMSSSPLARKEKSLNELTTPSDESTLDGADENSSSPRNKKVGFLRSFIEKFKKSPQKTSSPHSKQHAPITMVVAHNSPTSSPAKLRI